MRFSLTKLLALLATLFILNLSETNGNLSFIDDSYYSESFQDSSVLKTLI